MITDLQSLISAGGQSGAQVRFRVGPRLFDPIAGARFSPGVRSAQLFGWKRDLRTLLFPHG
jgi:hypothetical protein